MISFPKKGRSWEDLEAQMTEMSTNDLDWQHARHSSYVWHASDQVKEVAKKAYGLFISTNGLGKIVFPSLARMEDEVIQMVLGNFNGEGAAGHMSSGGTESIFLALKSARDWMRDKKPGITEPEIIAPFSAHPAVNKSAHYLGLKVVRVPTRDDFRADVDAMRAAVTENTIMLYGSAPAFSMGVIDPITDLGALAEEKGLWLHVDACVGGILGPFVRKAGYTVPAFDFSVPGVSSISADLHKSGFTAKGASTITFRKPELKMYAAFNFDDWPSGNYSSINFTGTAPGGAIAAAWAVMNYLGEEGYLEIAKTVMKARTRLEKGLLEIDGINVWGEPDLWALAFGSQSFDIMAVAYKMWEQGWMVAPNTKPAGIHFMTTPIHDGFIDEYLAVLKEAIASVKESGEDATQIEARYS